MSGSFMPRSILVGCLAITIAVAELGCSSGDEPGPGPADAAVEASTWQFGPITVVEQPGSGWTVSEQDGEVIAHHGERDLALLIDPTHADDDQRYAGVYLFERGQPRFTGSYYGSTCSMFVPDRPHANQTAVTVTAAGDALSVEMTEGSLSEMVDSQFESDEPFRWMSTWSVEPSGLRLQAGGLYYLLVPKESCDVTLRGEGNVELGTEHIESNTAPFLSYYEDVRAIEVESLPLGALSVATDAAVVQVQVTSYPDTSLFELDFDHSFKDRGQLDVRAEILLPLGPQ